MPRVVTDKDFGALGRINIAEGKGEAGCNVFFGCDTGAG